MTGSSSFRVRFTAAGSSLDRTKNALSVGADIPKNSRNSPLFFFVGSIHTVPVDTAS